MSDLMSTMALNQAIGDMLETVAPARIVRQTIATEEVVDKAGGVIRPSIVGMLPTLVAQWGPSDTRAWYVPQPSTVVRLAAYASTPPSSGAATVRLRVIPPGAGVTTLDTATIANGDSTGSNDMSEDIAAGSWLLADVTVPNGASGVSIAAAIRVR